MDPAADDALVLMEAGVSQTGFKLVVGAPAGDLDDHVDVVCDPYRRDLGVSKRWPSSCLSVIFQRRQRVEVDLDLRGFGRLGEQRGDRG